jgi:hypothetical protein
MNQFRPHLLLFALAIPLMTGAAIGLPGVKNMASLTGRTSWAGVQEIRLGKGVTIRPDSPLRLESALGGHVRAAIADDPTGTITMQQWKGHIRTVIRSPKHGTFLIKTTPLGKTTIIELDPSTLVGCETDSVLPPATDGDGGSGGNPAPPPTNGDAPETDGDAPEGDGGGVVDVLVVYTPSARINAGSNDAMETAIHGWVNESNDVYRDSDTATRIRLVGTAETNHVDSGSLSLHLSRLAGTSEGYMDEIHALRTSTGADVVVLIITNGLNCGLAYTIKNSVTGSPTTAFAVVRDYCADVQFSFVHEIGHVMGCCHDLDHPGSCAGGSSLYPQSFGHRFVGDTNNWRTVMAYTDSSSDPWTPLISYTRVGHFSNPDIDFDNEPTGQVAIADNASSLDSMRSITASYRTAITPITCPGDLGEDAIVGVSDLLDLLMYWGAIQPAIVGSLRADLNGDAEVDSSDLFVLLAQFGPCPG